MWLRVQVTKESFHGAMIGHVLKGRNRRNVLDLNLGRYSLLIQFGDNTPTLEATKPGRKSTSVVRIQQLSANHVCTNDLGPTRTDFNLGTPRFEIPSHSLTTDHIPCDTQITNTIKMKLPSNNTTEHRTSQLWGSLQTT
ncbi:hypothetical protein MTR_0022s0020 [Medicago truncatula]|uniref:Uncharacterized protein n=1 Tax=Medicago truncatula TaxID=3880 RepID=A0A072TIT7_MEDTR|nr:hypothetical protein MTR_0022s0020 [Medicago truncatula]